MADAPQRLGMITPPKVTSLTPSVDEPAAAPAPPGAAPAAAAAGTGWSTVKPHLAGR